MTGRGQGAWLGLALALAGLCAGGWGWAVALAGVALSAHASRDRAGRPRLFGVAWPVQVAFASRRFMFYADRIVTGAGLLAAAGLAAAAGYAKPTAGPLLFGGVVLGGLFLLAAVAGLSGALPLATAKQKNTFDFVLVTDLWGREIALGGLAGLLAGFANVLLPAAPVLAAALALGFPPWVALAALSLTLSVAAVSGAVGVFAACMADRGEQAPASAVGVTFLVGVLTLAAYLVPLGKFGWCGWPAVPGRLTLGEALQGVGLVNPLATAIDAGREWRAADGRIDVFLPGLWDRLTRAHLAGTLVFLAAAALAVRPVARSQADAAATAEVRAKAKLRPVKRPPVWDESVAWREAYCGGGRFVAFGRVGSFRLHAGGLAAAFVVGPVAVAAARGDWAAAAGWVVRIGSVVGVLGAGLLASIVATQTLARDTKANVTESLLLTDLSPGELLRQKWLGAVVGLSWVPAGLAVAWAAAVLAGVLSPLGVPLLAVLAAAYLNLGAVAGVQNAVYTAAKPGFWKSLRRGVPVMLLIGAGVAAAVVSVHMPGFLSGFNPLAAVWAAAATRHPPAELTPAPAAGVLAGAAAVALLSRMLWRRAVAEYEEFVSVRRERDEPPPA